MKWWDSITTKLKGRKRATPDATGGSTNPENKRVEVHNNDFNPNPVNGQLSMLVVRLPIPRITIISLPRIKMCNNQDVDQDV